MTLTCPQILYDSARRFTLESGFSLSTVSRIRPWESFIEAVGTVTAICRYVAVNPAIFFNGIGAFKAPPRSATFIGRLVDWT